MTHPLLDPRVLARLERLVRLARRAPAPQRRRRALRRSGRGIEPGARRDYAPGDDVRLIDWPAYARLERLLVKVVEELPEPRLELVVDGSGSMGHGRPTPLLRAGLAAAGVAAAAVAREARVTAWWAGPPASPGPRSPAPSLGGSEPVAARPAPPPAGLVPARLALRRPGELVRLLRFLAAAEPGGGGGLAATAERIVRTTRVRGGAVLLTDGLDPADAALAGRRLRGAGFDALVVSLAARAELEPAALEAALDAGRVELVDAETGRVRSQPFAAVAAEEAARARDDRRRRLTAALEEAGVPHEALGPDAAFEEVAVGLLGGAVRGSG